MTSLIDTIQGHLTSAIVGGVASQLGESEPGVTKALKGIVATILSGMAGKANDASALTGLFGDLADKGNAGFLTDLAGLVGGGNRARNDPRDISGKLMGALFGDKIGGVLQAITSFGGLKAGSASNLLGLAGPLVMGVLGKRIESENLNADGLKRLFATEGESFRKAVPPGVADILSGVTRIDARPIERATIAAASTAAAASNASRAMPAWVWAIPAVLGVGVVGWMLTRDGERKDIVAAPAEAITTAAAETQAAPAQTPPILATVEPVNAFVRNLGAFELRGATDGVEAKLISFIESGKAPCTDAECWFTFDRLTFETGSARLDMSASQGQIENIAEILRAFPGIQLKIGGYTDNTGSQEANMALSQARAEAVVTAVSALGVDASRLIAEGYGPQFPVASNDTENGRAQNRRIDVRIRERA